MNSIVSTSSGMGTTVDEAELQHVDVRDDESWYMTSYGEEPTSATTEEMTLSSADLVLPGLIPFCLTRIYDSSRFAELQLHFSNPPSKPRILLIVKPMSNYINSIDDHFRRLLKCSRKTTWNLMMVVTVG
ncbi:hypothetical protein IAQ67_12240 [Paenibacillus peoriae]|uniref:Uncharacterized protein n=2 Tax=Paenibacillus peoriae TaxID=59893 RepID=A0A7H0YF45_9BACL|nr:hypothetical protein IAQ67_12240 [Paenibacillus peoriae]